MAKPKFFQSDPEAQFSVDPDMGYRYLPTPPTLPTPPNIQQQTPAPTLHRDQRQSRTGMLLAALGAVMGGNRDLAGGFGAAFGQGQRTGEDARFGRQVQDWQRTQQQDQLVNADKWRRYNADVDNASRTWQMKNQEADRLLRDKSFQTNLEDRALQNQRYEEEQKRRAGDTWYNRWRDTMQLKRAGEIGADRERYQTQSLRVQYLRDVLRDPTVAPQTRQAALVELQSMFGGSLPGGAPAPGGLQAPVILPMSPKATADIDMGKARLQQGTDKMKQSASQFAERLRFQAQEGAANRAVRLQTAPKPKDGKITPAQAQSFAIQYEKMANDPTLPRAKRDNAAVMAEKMQKLSGVPAPKKLSEMSPAELAAAIRASGGDVATTRPRATAPAPRKPAPAQKAPTKRVFTPPKPKAKKPAAGEKIGRFIVEG